MILELAEATTDQILDELHKRGACVVIQRQDRTEDVETTLVGWRGGHVMAMGLLLQGLIKAITVSVQDLIRSQYNEDEDET